MSKKKRVLIFFRREPRLTTIRDKVIAKAYQLSGYKVCVKKLDADRSNDDYRWKWFDEFEDYPAPELMENGVEKILNFFQIPPCINGNEYGII